LKNFRSRAAPLLATLAIVVSFLYAPLAAAQSPEVHAEWALFNQILVIGIAVGVVVFGLLFYAIIRYRDRPQKVGAS
jgi:heme/copper-type cytochrome/quinol oxidase subunit 2